MDQKEMEKYLIDGAVIGALTTGYLWVENKVIGVKDISVKNPNMTSVATLSAAVILSSVTKDYLKKKGWYPNV